MDELAFLDATAQAELVRKGEVKPVELVEAAIGRIEAVNPQINAVIIPLFERARDRAAAGALGEGPFRGVPFLMKDLDVCTADEPFHCGMRFLKESGFVSDHDAYLAAKFREAGFVWLGKTNTPELGLTVTTEPVAYGPTRNPWNLEHSVGGSSGGSAAAVAAGLVPAAHASDGGGSIRIPASECGVVGLKPSRGRISLGPDYGEYWKGLVISHVVTRSVRDTAAVLDCVAGSMPGDPYTAPPPARPYLEELSSKPARLRIGVAMAMPAGVGQLHPDCVAALKATTRTLEDLGHTVEASYPRALDEFPEATAHFMTLVSSWTAAALDEWGSAVGRTITSEDVEPPTWGLAEMGRAVTAPAYIAACKWLEAYTRRMAAWWADGFDVLVTPTITQPPP
ncbi:MAG: amidase, partial [Candidatus Dadabacteria bacterium]